MNRKGQVGTYLIFLAVFVIITILGYFVFLRFATAKDVGTFSIFVVSLVAGVATFFSPCSFGLLPGYLSYFYTNISKEVKFRQSLFYGFLASLGLLAFNLVLFVIVASVGLGLGKEFSVAGGGSLSSLTLTIRTIVGLLLIFLGVVQLLHVPIFSRLIRGLSIKLKKGSLRGLFVYGFTYNLANIGCTGPILTGLIVLVIPSGVFNVIGAFVVYSLAMMLLMLSVSILSSVAKQKVESVVRFSPVIQNLSAGVLVAVGIFMLLSVVFANTFSGLFFR